MITARDTPADARRRKRARRRQQEDPAYLDFVRSFPCCICGELPVEPHHEPLKGAGGGGDWHDHKTVPLCQRHHNAGRQSRHGVGSLLRFQEIHGVVLADVIAELNTAYGVGR